MPAHAPAVCRRRVSGSLSLPSRGPFHLSFTVLYAIGRCRCLALRGGPRTFPLGSSCPVVLRYPPCMAPALPTGLSPSPAGLPSAVPLAAPCTSCGPIPRRDTRAGLGSSRSARRYSGNHFCLLLLRLLRCFSSPGALPRTMDSCAGTQGPALRGLPHSDTRGSLGICPSPRLFAACRVFRRPAAPRHPPCALPSLATARRLACRQALFSQFFSDFLILTSWFPNGTLPPVPQLWLAVVFGSLLVLLVFGFQGTNMTFRLFYQPLKTKIQIKF